MHLLMFPLIFICLFFANFLEKTCGLQKDLAGIIGISPLLFFTSYFFLYPAYLKASEMIRSNTTIPKVFVPIVTIAAMIAFFVVAFILLLLAIITAGYLIGLLQSFVRGFLQASCSED